MSAALLCESLSEHVPGSGGGGDANHLLLVDDDPQMVRTLEYYFARRGFRVMEAGTLAAAKAMYARHDAWSLVISDFHLPDGNGWELCRWIREQSVSAPPLLLISGAAVAANYTANVDFLPKPFSVQQLEARVAALVPRARTDSPMVSPRAVRE